jgi:hypothetical protein
MRFPQTHKEWQKRGNPIRAFGGKIIGMLSIVLGVVSIITGIIPCVNIISVIIGATGVVAGVFAFNQARHGRGNTSYAVAGVLLCIMGIALSIFVTQGVISTSVYHRPNDSSATHHDF